jgi:hypothetical protein
MTPRIETLRSFIRAEKHHEFRHSPEEFGLDRLNEKFREEGVSPVTRSARMPKMIVPAINAGSNAITTSLIIC